MSQRSILGDFRESEHHRKTISLVKSITHITVWVVGFILSATFLCAFLFYSKVSTSLISDKTGEVKLQLKNVEDSLVNYRGILQELWRQVYDEDPFSAGTELEKYNARKNLYTAFDEHIGEDSAISAIFYFDNAGETSLVCTSSGGRDSLVDMQIIYTYELDVSTFLEKKWNYIECGGKHFCYIKYQMYTGEIGMLVSMEQLFADLDTAMSGSMESYEVLTDGETAFVNGQESAGRKNIILEQQIADTTLSVRYYYQPQWYNYVSDYVIGSVVLLSAIGAFFSLFLFYFFRYYFVQPLNEIMGAMKTVEKGDSDIRISEEMNSEEMKNLSISFEHMLMEIKNLKIREYEQELRAANQKLSQLRSQLHPHFYLNALNTINSLAFQNENDKIRDYIYMLSEYMRYMMKIDRDFISLEEEIHNVETYIALQEFRCSCTFAYYIDCPYEIKKCKIPYLLLYTLVENVFKHGISSKENFFMLIECTDFCDREVSGVRIVIEDNGPGFPEDVLIKYGEIKEKHEETDHIGLNNIYRTLELQYGRTDLLKLENTVQGARVEVRIPYEIIDRG